MNNKNHPKWYQINGTLEQKINILAKNPYRYYIGPNVWTMRNSRQEILQDYLYEAIYNENYELCQKIIEVKTFMGIITNQKTDRDYIILFETENRIWNVKIKYILKNEGYFLKLYTTDDIDDRLNDCKAALIVNDELGQEDIFKLLENKFKIWRDFGGLPTFEKGGFLNKKDFETVVNRINEEVGHNVKRAIELKNSFIEFLEKSNLNPTPDGNNRHQWLAKCPFSGAKHPIMISTKNNTFGCGWCHKKGNQADLEKYLLKEKK